ncbi:cytochrome c [Prosthecobacter fusiformis]|uniref:Cytochrome c n=2 Tax=Prosthecobacter fusiformis TaxID=48464 RepID=A0A4R7SRN5_9BACT|nr:cytochrome c [Prosthecobacter fusiformis]
MPIMTGIIMAIFSRGAEAKAPQFEEHVLPILYHHCFSCHSEKQMKPKGGLKLDSAQAILASDSLVPGNPDKSDLLARVSLPHTDEDVMPPLEGGAQPLSKEERETLRQWIATGADFGGWVQFEHRSPPLEITSAPLIEKETLKLAAQVDQLVTKHHQAKGTKTNSPTNDETFVRRVYLDVAGRIPSLEESTHFLESTDSQKRALLINQLLAGEGYVSHTFNWKADKLRIAPQQINGQPKWLYDAWVKDSIRSGMPYDEFVRQLLTAKGYLWQTGAVGFYLRDLGMPLDHMSNMTRIFLGTRIECAQCHDHPLEPVTQKDFFQMAAYTYGVTNLGSSSGYADANVRQWPEIKTRMEEMGPDEALRQGVSRTISYLKRLTADSTKQLRFPKDYAYDTSARGKKVEPRTLFGDEAPASMEDRRQVFASWMTSPRNPRFATNIANLLWKRVMGAGLVEPVDSLSAISRSEHGDLLEFLTKTMIGLKFDERAFLAVILNTQLYQSDADRETPETGAAFALRGPLLRRLSAEQVWDSYLTLLAEDIDERKGLRRYDHSDLDKERLLKLTDMTPDQVLERARVEMDYRIKHRAHLQRLTEQSAERKTARNKGDAALERRLQTQHRAENARFEEMAASVQMSGFYYAKETDPRWSKLPHYMLRASETPLPLPMGHFLRQFGQSDRREIDAFKTAPNTTHSLALMNGELTSKVLDGDSFLRSQLRPVQDAAQRTQLIYRAILVRSADTEELEQLAALTQESTTPEDDLIWSLLNSPEFLFIQ